MSLEIPILQEIESLGLIDLFNDFTDPQKWACQHLARFSIHSKSALRSKKKLLMYLYSILLPAAVLIAASYFAKWIPTEICLAILYVIGVPVVIIWLFQWVACNKSIDKLTNDFIFYSRNESTLMEILPYCKNISPELKTLIRNNYVPPQIKRATLRIKAQVPKK